MDIQDVSARLERLETENRRMKKLGLVVLIFASVFFVSGQAKTNKVVEANEFRLLDIDGRIRAKLMTNDIGQTSLTLTDSTDSTNDAGLGKEVELVCCPVNS